MIHFKQIALYLMSFCVSTACFALETKDPRTVISLNDGWAYKPVTEVKKDAPFTEVDLPHTWNTNYVKGIYYNREMMVYKRDLEVTPEMNRKRLFLYFEGVNSVTNVIVNKSTVGTHQGGYTAFCFEITDFIKQGINGLEIWVSNAYRSDVLPISGDFNVYGGIHRPCYLIVTERNCISPLFYASPGVFIHQNSISNLMADITVETVLSLKEKKGGISLRTVVVDMEGKIVAQGEENIVGQSVKQSFKIQNPVLWDGKLNPYLYDVVVELYDNGKLIDKVLQKTGFRYFSVDADKGFFLNGNYLDLHGFCIHEDVKGKGSALTQEDFDKDMELILESGATSMRLVHYPHSETMYKLCDANGIVLWTEIPLCGPGGYDFTGFFNTESFRNNAKETLKELVYQKFNHPSICFWGIFNELLVTDGNKYVAYDDPQSFVKELNALYKQLDPSRLTTLASNVGKEYFNNSSDLMAWNKYFGWYSGSTEEAGDFFDDIKSTAEGQPIGVSEYGAGASIYHHQWPLDKNNKPDGGFHPEEWQNVFHEGNWSMFLERPYLWGKYIWVFADFQSSIRKEGDRIGINDKGMLTYDRKTKKDAFYFYKANWNSEPMLYISSRRFVDRNNPQTQVKVYTNVDEAVLYINGEKISAKKKNKINCIIWDDILLTSGENIIRVEAKSREKILTDSCVWLLRE